ncbi:MAG: tyrosine-type recombinase/integrase, partial [Phycisphaerae bacterium]
MARKAWAITREMFLSETEAARLIRHVRSRAESVTGRDAVAARLDQLIVETLLFSGLRNSEFCGLKLCDTPAVIGRPVLFARGADGKRRTVWIPRVLAALIGQWTRQSRPLLLPEGVAPDDPSQALVFNERRRPYERSGLYRRVVRILTEAGMGERASVQLLRHTYGYLAYLRTGGNLLFVQRQLGHAHPMVTSIYARFVEESYERLANRLAGARTEPRGAASAPRAAA